MTGANLVAGAEYAEGQATFTAVNPRTGEAGDVEFHEATEPEVAAAAAAAAEAFSVYADWSLAQRAALLRAMAAALEAAAEPIVETADRETALGEARLTGELARTTGQLNAFADFVAEGWYLEAIIDTADPDAKPVPRPDLRRMLVPLGPVAVFGPSNFPLAFSVPGGDTASALAAGCPVVVKGHPSHPATSELCARALLDACKAQDAPAGLLSLLQGRSTAVGEALVTAPEIAAVGFTGSPQGGRALYALGAQRPVPIPVYAEMGSLNPQFVTGGAIKARVEDVAEGFVGSMTMGNGQFCTKPNLVFVPEGEADAFVGAAAERLRGREAAPLLDERTASALAERLAETTSLPGVEVAVAGEPTTAGGFRCTPSLLVADLEAFRAQEGLRTEHFGPVAIVVRCPAGSFEDVVALLPGSLAASVHAEPHDVAQVDGLERALRTAAGRLIWNGYPTGVAVTTAMHHGGPYPATTVPAHTSVGATAIRRWLRGVAYQDMPQELLPPPLQDDNPLGILRLVNGEWTRASVQAG